MIESFRNFLNSTYNRDSTYIFFRSEIGLSTVLIIESLRNFANSTYNREGAYNRVMRVLTVFDAFYCIMLILYANLSHKVQHKLEKYGRDLKTGLKS